MSTTPGRHFGSFSRRRGTRRPPPVAGARVGEGVAYRLRVVQVELAAEADDANAVCALDGEHGVLPKTVRPLPAVTRHRSPSSRRLTTASRGLGVARRLNHLRA